MPQTTGSETVLLVEDEPSIRQLMRRMLQGLGYKMIDAQNGPEAVTVAERHQDPIDLLLTDVVMPSMDGFEVATRVALLHPETRVLFLSGHAVDSEKVREGLRKTTHRFLLKPFTQQTLKEKIREVLDAPVSS